jgi:hypothetical protein
MLPYLLVLIISKAFSFSEKIPKVRQTQRVHVCPCANVTSIFQSTADKVTCFVFWQIVHDFLPDSSVIKLLIINLL